MLEKVNWFKPLESILEYPKDYNPRVHGPYNPARYYGKPDVPFGDVKIKDLMSWFLRRDISVKSVGSALARASWRYRFKYILPKKSSPAPIYHVIFVGFVAAFLINEYDFRSKNTYAKYH